MFGGDAGHPSGFGYAATGGAAGAGATGGGGGTGEMGASLAGSIGVALPASSLAGSGADESRDAAFGVPQPMAMTATSASLIGHMLARTCLPRPDSCAYSGMSDSKLPTWADVRRIADELKLKVHLAGMEARQRWDELQPSLAEAEKEISRGGSIVAAKLVEIGGALKEIGKDVADRVDRITHEPPNKG